jgi:hypothetical protein
LDRRYVRCASGKRRHARAHPEGLPKACSATAPSPRIRPCHRNVDHISGEEGRCGKGVLQFHSAKLSMAAVLWGGQIHQTKTRIVIIGEGLRVHAQRVACSMHSRLRIGCFVAFWLRYLRVMVAAALRAGREPAGMVGFTSGRNTPAVSYCCFLVLGVSSQCS